MEGLLREKGGFQPWQGQACTAYTSGMPDLNVEDVIKYVQAACEVGLDYKPYGSPGKKSGNSPVEGQSTYDVDGQESY